MGAEAEGAARELYEKLIQAWNKRNARDYALQFASNGSIVGYDGSQVDGQLDIGAHISEIFSHHQTASYVTIVREVRPISSDVVVLRANAGMVPPGKDELNPDRNAVQSMIAARKGGKWEIALFQNTPAVYDGRPELSKKLTQELRDALREKPFPK
ncbi:MAG TPA: SgcJ/EcaC family oxidoreductase [Gemmatimonadaceae bacterium]|nr:SgcJ/EcaC family oxidoreductase [Gemmatimonadaceae bacterium]